MRGFFEDAESWKKHWKGMPEFIQEDQKPFQSIIVHFETLEDRKEFARLMEQTITSKTRFIWFPKLEKMDLTKRICDDES